MPLRKPHSPLRHRLTALLLAAACLPLSAAPDSLPAIQPRTDVDAPATYGPRPSALQRPLPMADSLPLPGHRAGLHDPHNLWQTLYTGAPLLAASFAFRPADKHLRHMRAHHIPNFHTEFDNYLQYAPAAVMLGLKAAGVESRSSWGRMLTSDAFSAAIMAIAVNGIKYTSKVRRPDGSSRNSFPSGHTATVFMTAAMLSREYGHKSPWVSIGSYTVATATGVLRTLNNRHWLSDVMAGAVVGYASTQLGYFLGDLIFRDRGLNVREEPPVFDRMDKPSYVGIDWSWVVPLGGVGRAGGHRLRAADGLSLAVEGAGFINPYLGFGGKAELLRQGIDIDGAYSGFGLNGHGIYAGVFGSYPLADRWRIGGKLMPGYAHWEHEDAGVAHVGNRDGFGLTAGVQCTFRAHPNYNMSLTADYNLRPAFVSAGAHCSHALHLALQTAVAF